MPVDFGTPPREGWISYCLKQKWSVIPLVGGPDVQHGKRPAVRWEPFARCHPTPADLENWSDYSAYGVVCGAISGLVVLDLDDAALTERFFRRFPDLVNTLIVQSGNRGMPHIYWHVDFPVKTRHFPAADLKAEGGYVVGPGSIIGGATWTVTCYHPVRSISRDELDSVLVFLQPAEIAQPCLAQPVSDKGADYAAIYGFLVDRQTGRNQALFTAARYMRDAGHPEPATIQRLADLHARQFAANSAEPYSRRYAEALRTIASVYTRPPRRVSRSESEQASYLPNQVREALLTRPDGAAIGRTLEGAVLCGARPGSLVTELLLCQMLNGIVSRETIRKALHASYETGAPIFCPPENPPADAEIPNGMTGQKNAFLSGGQKQTKPARWFRLPTPETLCRCLGVQAKGSDPITLDDVCGSRQYRQALHRALLRRRPGTYAQTVLANRLGITTRSVRRYNREMPVRSMPTYDETPILWLNLDHLPSASDLKRHQIDTGGQFLLDETGKRWPVKREIAAQLLRQGKRVSQMRQRCNYYWYGEMVTQAAENHTEQMDERDKCRHADTCRVVSAVQADDCQRYTAEDAGPALQDSPDSAREGRSTRFCGDEAVETDKSPLRRHKRRFKQQLADAVAEGVAKRAFDAVDDLSLPNARRLVDVYGIEPVLAALRKLRWLREQGKVRNPAGMLVTLARTSWRARHNKPSPQFAGEPVRKSRRVTYVSPNSDSLLQSTEYQDWRTTFFGLDDVLAGVTVETISF